MITAEQALMILKSCPEAEEILPIPFAERKLNQPEIYSDVVMHPDWDKDYFASEFGSQVVTAHELNTNTPKQMELGDYLEHMFVEKSDEPIMCHWQIKPRVIDFIKPGTLGEDFENWFYMNPKVDNPHWRWVIFGPRGGGTKLHSDIGDTAAWNHLMKGEKVWVFFEAFPSENRNIFESEEVLYDEIRLGVKAFYIVQREGQFVWIPSRWIHQVVYKTPCIAVSENFINQRNIHMVKEFYESRDPQAFKALSMIQNYCETAHDLRD